MRWAELSPREEVALEERGDSAEGVLAGHGGTHGFGRDGDRVRERDVLALVGRVGTRHDESVDRGSHQCPCHLHGYPWDKASAQGDLAPGPRAAPSPTPTQCPHSRYAVAESRSFGLGVRSMVSAV